MDSGLLEKDFIDWRSLNATDLQQLLAVARYLKDRRASGVMEHALAGKTLAMYFEKPSLRTRVSFEVAMSELGGRALYLSRDEVGLGKREAVEDVARVLSRYVHGIMVRTFAHDNVTDLARHASVPVINGLSDASHPCQALADLLTVQEHFGTLAGKHLVFIGDGNNVSLSLARACALADMRFTLACPEAYAFPSAVAEEFVGMWGDQVRQLHDPLAAVADADVLYSDVFTSMGQEDEAAQRRADFATYQINTDLLEAAPATAKVMHCLPAHRGEEITAEVMEGPQAIVFDQAENRLHAQKAILRLLMADDRTSVLVAAQAVHSIDH
jgi:ornithine carbamoyltransferase